MEVDEFEKVVDLLNGSPNEQCVVRRDFLVELDIDPESLARATARSFQRAVEFTTLLDERKIALRDVVFVFAPKEAE